MRTVKFFVALSTLSLFASISISPALAVSCTEQGRTCAAWAVGPNASYKAACSKEVGACKARCKKGQKFFLGVAVGNQYPIDTCN
jgi:hypothetical protein